MAPTLRDVAARAGVSPKTVSRVINHEPSVQAKTQARVSQAIKELRYRPDLSARSLGSARAYAIGLVYDDANSYDVLAVQKGALSACREMGFGLQIYPCAARAPDLTQALIDLVQHARLAGVVLSPPMSENRPLLGRLTEAGVHLVRIVSAAADPADGWPCVYVNDRDAARSITAHLIQLGHTRIGFLGGDKEHRSSRERFRGYAAALQDYEIALDQRLVVEGEYAFEDGFRRARRLLSLDRRPTAIFGSNDEIAAGVLAAARATGLEVPYDLSIAGFEDMPISRQSWPALTTVRQDTADIARHATVLLIAGLGKSRAVDLHNQGFSPELVVRASTAPPRRKPRGERPVA